MTWRWIKNRPMISIIIPTYNRNNILKRAIQSALNQTFQDFEIIVIDDASTKSPEKLITSFNDSRIKYFCHESNRGANAARNTGIKLSSGKYIAFLDSDDEWVPDKLECQIKHLENLPVKVGAHYSGSTTVSPEGVVLSHRIPSASGDILSKLLTGNCVGPLSSVMVRRSALDHAGFFDEHLPSSQDWDLYIRIAYHYHFSVTPTPLLRYHLTGDSITKNLKAKALGRKMILNKYEDQIKKNPLAFSWQLTRTGHYYCRAGLTDEGHREFLRAIRVYPLSRWGYFYFFCSIFGSGKYNQLVSLSHRLFNYVLKRGP